MKKGLFVGIMSIIIYIFIGVINTDDEFGEGYRLLIKIPPTTQFYFPYPPHRLYEEYYDKFYPDKLTEAESDPHFSKVIEFKRRMKSIESMRDWGEMAALLLIEILLIAIFIKPVFSKKIKWILIDIALFALSAFTTLLIWTWMFWALVGGESLIRIITFVGGAVLLAHYILLRLLRPVKKYNYAY